MLSSTFDIILVEKKSLRQKAGQRYDIKVQLIKQIPNYTGLYFIALDHRKHFQLQCFSHIINKMIDYYISYHS